MPLDDRTLDDLEGWLSRKLGRGVHAKWLRDSDRHGADRALAHWRHHPDREALAHHYRDVAELKRVKVDTASRLIDALENLFGYDFVRQSMVESAGVEVDLAALKAHSVELGRKVDSYLAEQDVTASRVRSRPEIDALVAGAKQEVAALLTAIGEYDAVLTRTATECRTKVESWPVDAFVEAHRSKGREYFAHGCAAFDLIATTGGAVLSVDPKVAPIVDAVRTLRDKIESGVDALLPKADLRER